MAAYNKYDPRLESLVMETRTFFDDDVAKELSADDQKVVAEAIHRHPELAAKINYDRSHTGFTREITVTADDIARLYAENVASQ